MTHSYLDNFLLKSETAQAFSEHLELRRLKNKDHRDEKYTARVLELSTKVVYDVYDLTTCYPSKRNKYVQFDPDNEDHWTIWSDMGNLWYDHSIHRDDNTAWTVSITHRPYDKRRSGTICGLSYARRPVIDMTRWRLRVDEASVYSLFFFFDKN